MFCMPNQSLLRIPLSHIYSENKYQRFASTLKVEMNSLTKGWVRHISKTSG